MSTQQEFTEADYDIDLGALMRHLGIEPGHIVADSARLDFVQGKVLLRYESVRAVPARLLALAMATATGLMAPATAQQMEQQEQEEQS